MKLKLTWLMTLFMAFVMQFSFAQEKTVSGMVTGASDGLPLPGVSVIVKGTTRGVQTDFDGKYAINVRVGETLVFSFVSMKSTEVTVGASNTINVAMEEDIAALDEVVIVGYGSGKKLGSVVGSVVQVSAEKIQDKPSANVIDALQGKVAGIQVFSSSGEPSQTQSIRLHGVGSLGSSSTPLFILDGVPISSGNMVSLNSNDFESVTILKDASATSIYGSRAANGVIYITSKKGKRGEKAVINVRSQYGYSKLANTDFFRSMMNRTELMDFYKEVGVYDQSDIDNINKNYPGVDTEWYKVYYKDYAPTSQKDISVSGGGEKTSYYLSAGLFKQEGLAYRSDFKRYTLRSNIDSKVNDWFQVGLNLALGYDDRQTNPYGANSTNRGLALLAQPFYSPVDKDGKPYVDRTIPGWGRYHPNYLADKNPSELGHFQFNPTGYLKVNLLKNLTYKSQMGIDFYDSRGSSKRLPSYVGSLGNGSVTEFFDRGILQTINNTLEYDFKVLANHNVTLLAGQEYSKSNFESFSASSSGQNDDRLVLLGAGPNNKDVGQGKSDYVFNSYFGRLDYNFNHKYFIDGTVRRDGSSRFGSGNKYATFWSAGAMWDIKTEDFMSNVDWFDTFKIKFSTGTSGNAEIGNYNSLATVGTNQYESNVGWNLSAPGNSNLQWESQTKSTIGISLGFFNRVRLDVDLYKRVTKDMLVSVPYPYTSGFANITSNVGALENKGIDLTFDFDLVKGDDFFITPYVNFNYNQEKITELFQDRDYWIIPNTGVAWAVGQPVSYFYPVFHQVNPQTGAPEWYVPNADPDQVVNPNFDPNNVTSDFSTGALQQNTGLKRYPPLNGGFGLSTGYKGFYFQADFIFSQGKYLLNNDRYFFENPNAFTGFNTAKISADYWKNPGDVTTFPSWDHQFTQFDARLIENASFIRLKNVQLGYTLPKELLGGQDFVKGAKFYILTRNLLTWTKYSGPDPEVDSNIGLGTNPNTKQFTFGVEIQL
ncbi:SusC/RagA family TonB-linked outer membrane protein [Gelidibacter japonicus]|uniref:SusC/RagA family TonB-linked outer membrane protein n=1 Tax=Gelidibacter japonicus TaxID=1962232 RepID=UPI003A93C66B